MSDPDEYEIGVSRQRLEAELPDLLGQESSARLDNSDVVFDDSRLIDDQGRGEKSQTVDVVNRAHLEQICNYVLMTSRKAYSYRGEPSRFRKGPENDR